MQWNDGTIGANTTRDRPHGDSPIFTDWAIIPPVRPLVRLGNRAMTKQEKAAYMKLWRLAHKVERAEYQRAWNESHPNYKKAYNKAYRQAHRAEIRAYWAAYYQAHKDETDARVAAWNNANRSHVTAYRAERYRAHRDKARAQTAAWQKAHPDKCRDNNAHRHALKLGATVEYVERAVVFERDNGRCHVCGKKVDPKDWHLDHIVPLSKGGEHSYRNVAMAHPDCNMKKYAKLIGQLRLF